MPLAVLLAGHEPEVARRYLARAGLRVIVAASADDTIAALRLQAAMGPAYRPGSGRAVDVQIAQLRAKLATSAVAAAIRTVRGAGYILDDPMDGAHAASNCGVPAAPLTAPRYHRWRTINRS